MWPVAPICEKQLKDVNPDHLVWHDGLPVARLCNVDSAGGGYDLFGEYAEQVFGRHINWQFIVQMAGCPFRCPYCYVTEKGIHDFVSRDTDVLLDLFRQTKVDCFHLMGGAPALYLPWWHHFIDALPEGKIFHSDFLLVERVYTPWLESVARSNCLYAVSIKGNNQEEYKKHTGKNIDWDLFWVNLGALAASKVNYYLTFTGIEPDDKFLKKILRHRKVDYFHIPIRWELEALK